MAGVPWVFTIYLIFQALFKDSTHVPCPPFPALFQVFFPLSWLPACSGRPRQGRKWPLPSIPGAIPSASSTPPPTRRSPASPSGRNRTILPKSPSHLAFQHDSSLVFITLQESDEIAAIDLNSQAVKWKLPVGPQPAGIWMIPDDRRLLVDMTGADYVQVIDWRTLQSVKKITTGKGAHHFLPAGDGRRVLLSNRMADTLSIIDQNTLSVRDTFALPGGPDDMEIRRDGTELWVSSRWTKKVIVVDMLTKKILHSIPVGHPPHGIYFHTRAPRR